jgi:hypothetical protein
MSTEEARRRWHAYYTEKRIVHQWFQVHLLKDLDVERVLEVGPFLGLASAMLDNAGYRVTTLDITPEPPGPGIARHIQADLRKVRPEQLAGHDAILCCETLEHIPWNEVGETLSVPWLIVSVPYEGFQFGFSLYVNRFLWRKRSFLKKLRFLAEFPDNFEDDWEPHKWEIGYKGYSVARWRDLVTGAGYEIVGQDFTSGCRSIFLVARNTSTAATGT